MTTERKSIKFDYNITIRLQKKNTRNARLQILKI